MKYQIWFLCLDYSWGDGTALFDRSSKSLETRCCGSYCRIYPPAKLELASLFLSKTSNNMSTSIALCLNIICVWIMTFTFSLTWKILLSDIAVPFYLKTQNQNYFKIKFVVNFGNTQLVIKYISYICLYKKKRVCFLD